MRWCTCPDNDEVIVSEDFIIDTIRYSIYYFECLPVVINNSYFLTRRLEDLRVFFNEAYSYYTFHGTSQDCNYIEWVRDKLVHLYQDKIYELEASENV